MTIDAIIMAVLCYGFYVGGFTYGLVRIILTERKKERVLKQS